MNLRHSGKIYRGKPKACTSRASGCALCRPLNRCSGRRSPAIGATHCLIPLGTRLIAVSCTLTPLVFCCQGWPLFSSTLKSALKFYRAKGEVGISPAGHGKRLARLYRSARCMAPTCRRLSTTGRLSAAMTVRQRVRIVSSVNACTMPEPKEFQVASGANGGETIPAERHR